MFMLRLLGKEMVRNIDLNTYSFDRSVGFTTHDKFSFFATWSGSDFNHAFYKEFFSKSIALVLLNCSVSLLHLRVC